MHPSLFSLLFVMIFGDWSIACIIHWQTFSRSNFDVFSNTKSGFEIENVAILSSHTCWLRKSSVSHMWHCKTCWVVMCFAWKFMACHVWKDNNTQQRQEQINFWTLAFWCLVQIQWHLPLSTTIVMWCHDSCCHVWCIVVTAVCNLGFAFKLDMHPTVYFLAMTRSLHDHIREDWTMDHHSKTTSKHTLDFHCATPLLWLLLVFRLGGHGCWCHHLCVVFTITWVPEPLQAQTGSSHVATCNWIGYQFDKKLQSP